MSSKFDTHAISGKHRLAFIDSLRAVAILLVFARHATEVFVHYGYGTRLVLKLTDWFDFGGLGVIIFFAISGFLIPSSLHGDGLSGSVRYVLSRGFRLYPAFLVSVIPSAATHYWLGGKVFSRHDLVLNFTMIPRLFGAQLANGAYWTLEVEVCFYVLCLVLFLGGVIEQTFVFAAITLVTFAIFQSSQQELFDGLLNPNLSGEAFFFCVNISVMCWGAVFRHWWSGRRLNPGTAVIFWSFALFWIAYRPLCLIVAVLQDRLAEVDTNITAAYGLGVGIFLVVALHGRLRNPLMLWIGRISYSFYLLHGVAIHLIQRELERHPSLHGFYAGLYSVLALGLSLILAQLSFTLVERPGIRLGRAVIARALAALEDRRGHGAGWLQSGMAPLLARPHPSVAGVADQADRGQSRFGTQPVTPPA